ncbi:MAG TPA: response regulator transcription factor [Spirillospora sp.]|nr:response regulator transcription factor [Spirillospora sp.]
MRLIVAEDALLEREGLVSVLSGLGHEVVAAAVRAEQVPGLVARHLPDAAILDVRLPPTHTDEGLRLAAHIRGRHTRTAVLVLSKYVETSYATELLRTGGSRVGYLLKDRLFEPAVLGDALDRLAAGEAAIDPEVVAELVAPGPGPDLLAQLTPRERDVLTLMAQGLSDRGIAERLVITEKTVGSHARGVFGKLRISTAPTSNRRVSAVLTYLTARRLGRG